MDTERTKHFGAVSGGNLREYYARGIGVAGDVGSLAAETRFGGGDPETVFLHADWRGCVVLATDAAGNAVGRYGYSAYGEPFAAGAANRYAPRFGFSSKERDASGLVYYGFRHASPELCRWITPDPARESGGLNLYAFCGGNPICYVDEEGHWVTVAIGAVVGGIWGGVTGGWGGGMRGAVSGAIGGIVSGAMVGAGASPAWAAAVGTLVSSVLQHTGEVASGQELNIGRRFIKISVSVLCSAIAAKGSEKIMMKALPNFDSSGDLTKVSVESLTGMVDGLSSSMFGLGVDTRANINGQINRMTRKRDKFLDDLIGKEGK